VRPTNRMVTAMFHVQWQERLNHRQRAELIRLERERSANEKRYPHKISALTLPKSRAFRDLAAARKFVTELRAQQPDNTRRAITVITSEPHQPAEQLNLADAWPIHVRPSKDAR
jgi:hypothetical protein